MLQLLSCVLVSNKQLVLLDGSSTGAQRFRNFPEYGFVILNRVSDGAPEGYAPNVVREGDFVLAIGELEYLRQRIQMPVSVNVFLLVSWNCIRHKRKGN